jgi:hypothetical protein
MNLINEKHPWDDFCFSLLSPFRYFFINLFSNFLSNLTSGSRKQGQKSLRSRVDNIDFVKSNCMYYLFSFLYFSLRTIYKSCLRSHSIIFWSSCEASSCFWDFTWSFINSDNIPGNNLLLLNCLNHFLT